jgi:hypothetical protein
VIGLFSFNTVLRMILSVFDKEVTDPSHASAFVDAAGWLLRAGLEGQVSSSRLCNRGNILHYHETCDHLGTSLHLTASNPVVKSRKGGIKRPSWEVQVS